MHIRRADLQVNLILSGNMAERMCLAFLLLLVTLFLPTGKVSKEVERS